MTPKDPESKTMSVATYKGKEAKNKTWKCKMSRNP
jgi:hypothetical protein